MRSCDNQKVVAQYTWVGSVAHHGESDWRTTCRTVGIVSKYTAGLVVDQVGARAHFLPQRACQRGEYAGREIDHIDPWLQIGKDVDAAHPIQ